MLHSKTIIIDDDWSSIGTLNMDNVSLLYNFEANIISTNVRFADDLISHFLHDKENCEQMTIEKWDKQPMIRKIAMFFMKFIRGFF